METGNITNNPKGLNDNGSLVRDLLNDRTQKSPLQANAGNKVNNDTTTALHQMYGGIMQNVNTVA